MGQFIRCGVAVLGLVVAASAAQGAPPPKAIQPSTAIHQQTLLVAGLQKAARVVIDHWGIAHIFAASAHDAFFVQGYNAARDRLWQIDLWRKRGLGLLAKSFGAAYVDQDRATRLFLYRGDMRAEWAAYAPGTQEATAAFVAGINAYVGEVLHGAKPLPPEFALTHSLPEPWATDDVVRIRSHALVSNVLSEVARARVVCLAGLDADKLRRKLEPAHTTKVPGGLDACDITEDVLKAYTLATQQVDFKALTHTASAGGVLRIASAAPDAMNE
ncbi:MAG: penicillin acylase family protein, partial [Alphaproteobacteria bacterium]|nr:penicillin acylase family protein [Alphaproteobacteria bacterium]